MRSLKRLAVPVMLALMLVAALATSAGAEGKHVAVPHYNACSSGRHTNTAIGYTLPGDGSFAFRIWVQSWLDSSGNYCGVKQPVMHSWETESFPIASDEMLRHEDLGLWIGSTNFATWAWDCPGVNNCPGKDNWWYGPDIHDLSCSSAVYAVGAIWEAGDVGEFRPGLIYNSDWESTSAPSYTMPFC